MNVRIVSFVNALEESRSMRIKILAWISAYTSNYNILPKIGTRVIYASLVKSLTLGVSGSRKRRKYKVSEDRKLL